MSMELPCITSELANNALKAEKDNQILIGKTPQDYADIVLKLLEDKAFNLKIAQNGKQFVTNTYNWNAITQDLENDFFQGS